LYLEGNNDVTVGDKRYRCTPGDLLIVDPDIEHHLHTYSPGGHRRIVLTFEYTDGTKALRMPFRSVLSLLYGTVAANDQPVHHLSTTARKGIAHQMQALSKVLEAAHGETEFRANVQLFELFLLIAESLRTGSSHDSYLAGDGLLRAKRLIERSFASKLNIGALAATAHYSQNHFITAFRERFGDTPIAYQLSLRVRAAKNLLRASSLSAKEIAREVGFSDAQYFARVFRKARGTSPIHFRRSASGSSRGQTTS